MSAMRARLLVWSALMVAMPVPLAVVGRGRVPPGVLAQLLAATLAVGVVERGDGTVGILAAVLALQLVVWAFVGWLVAGLVVRGLRGVAPRAVGVLTLLLVLAGVIGAAREPIYRSPFHASLARQTLHEVYR